MIGGVFSQGDELVTLYIVERGIRGWGLEGRNSPLGVWAGGMRSVTTIGVCVYGCDEIDRWDHLKLKLFGWAR